MSRGGWRRVEEGGGGRREGGGGGWTREEGVEREKLNQFSKWVGNKKQKKTINSMYKT